MASLGPGRWLDIGCGPRSLVAHTLPGTLFGIDCNMEMLRGAGRHGAICYTCGNATTLPFGAESFDGVVSFGMLHHLNDTDADRALCEMQRVTRPGGIVMVFDSVRPVSAARRPVAALLRAIDCGRHVRNEAALSHLLNLHEFEISRRITYSWTGLEELCAIFSSAPAGN
jgi:ubiquinone/menaquinone biosynthesis C-methylase UbiE